MNFDLQTEPLKAAVFAVQELIGELSDIRGAPEVPPEKITVYPFSVAYPGRGTYEKEAAGQVRGLHTITVEIHTIRKNLPRDIRKIIGVMDLIAAVILADENFNLGGTVDTITSLGYEFGPLGYDALDTLGYTLQIGVKIRSA